MNTREIFKSPEEQHSKLYLASGIRRFVSGSDHGTNIPAFVIFDIHGKVHIQADMKFSPHSVVQHPLNPAIFVLLDKGGPVGALAYTTPEKTVRLKYFKASSSEYSIYGHGAFFNNNESFIITERAENFEGQLVIRDAETFEVKSRVPLPGFGPHDCKILEGNLLAVAMDGTESESHPIKRAHRGTVLIYDLKTFSLVEKMDCKLDAGFGHLAVLGSELIGLESGLWASGDRGQLSVGKIGETFESLRGTENMNRWGGYEALSVAVDSKRSRVLATNPLGNLVTCWDIRSRTLISAFEVPSPSGVFSAPDLENYIVTSSLGFIFYFCPEKLRLIEMVPFEIPGQFQAHLEGVYL